MQISKIIILALISVHLYTIASLKSQAWTKETGKGYLKCAMGSMSGSSYFESDGFRRSGLYDSLAFTNYTFDFSGTLLLLQGEYGVRDNLTMFASIPIGAYSMTEKFVTDSIGNRPIRAQLNRTLISWIALGAAYQLYSGPLTATIRGEYRMPPISGPPNDPTQEFLGGGSHEGIFGLHIGVPFDKSWIEVSGSIALRENNWNDRFLIHAESGFSSVENTALKFFIDLQQPLGAQRDIPIFQIRRIHPAEFFVVGGASFSVNLPDGLMLEAMYNLRLLGTSAWSIGTVLLSAGYAF